MHGRLEDLRPTPATIENKMLAWRHWGVAWSLIHYAVGVSSAVLSALAAANAKANLLSSTATLAMAGSAAGLTFLITALDARKKGSQFESASRYLERAISLYQTDASLEPKFLGESQAEALKKYLS